MHIIGSLYHISSTVSIFLIIAKYQRCTVHFYRIVFSVVPNNRLKEIAKMLKTILAQEDKQAALEKADFL